MRFTTVARLDQRGLAILVAMTPLGLASSATAQPVATPVETTFDQDLDGWAMAPGQDISLSYSGSGGSPGGFAFFAHTNVGRSDIEAPAPYLGSWSSLDVSGVLLFDHKIIDLGELPQEPPYIPYEVALAGGASLARFISTETAQTTWTTVTVPIQEELWVVETGTWTALLASVDNLQIRIELVANPGGNVDDQDGIDNVLLLGGYPSPALVVRVVYQTESIVDGPLSFGLPVLPESLTATIVLSDIDAAENVTAGLGDVASFSLGFGDGQWTELTSFSMVTDGSGEVTTLSFSTTQIDTLSVLDGIVLNSSFSATISGTDIASGQDFEYNYADSEQTLVVLPGGPAIPTASEWGLVVMTLLAMTVGTVVLSRRAKSVVG